tara:strand:- start:1362 stop:2438 length:1077 start_codon:yes stop_codon:yes gene_type:complete
MFGSIVRLFSFWIVGFSLSGVALAGEALEVVIDAEEATLGHDNLEGFFYTLEECRLDEGVKVPLEVQVGGSGNGGGQFEVTAFGTEPAFYRIGKFSMDVPQDEGTRFIVDRPAFEFFAERSDFPGAVQAREVKFLIENVDTDSPRLYFLNTGNVEFHYYFARDSLGVSLSLAAFNSQTYFTGNKHFIAGSLVAHDHFVGESGEQGIYTMEFWPTDPVGFKYVSVAYDLLTKGMPFAADNTYYHAPSETQRNIYNEELSLYESSEVKVVRTTTNRSGGVQGGITNGEDVCFRVAFKPTATLLQSQKTVDIDGNETELKARGRHDPCVLPRAVPIVEAMANLVALDHWMRQHAQNRLFTF